jgi:Leucine-rich repeat (LRR) protein
MGLIRFQNSITLHRIHEHIIHTPNPLDDERGLIMYKKEKNSLKRFIREEVLFAAEGSTQLKNVLKIRYGHLVELFLPLPIFARSIKALKYFEKLEKLEIKLNQPMFFFHEELEQIPMMRFVEISDDEYISLSFNDINLPNLKSLKIHGINSDRIKIQFSTLNKLEELSIQNTTLFFPPKTLFDLINLKKLVLNNNLLLAMPEEIGLLQDLEYLDLSNNMIKFIPESLLTLIHLGYLDLRDNDLDKQEETNQQIILILKERGCKVIL